MTTRETFPLGIDVSKKTFDVALLREEKYKNKKFANTVEGFQQLQSWLNHQDVSIDHVHACLESTGIYSRGLATYLHDQGCQVSVINGAQVKGFAQGELSRTKTDKKDACVLARFCRAMNPPLWQPETREIRELKALVRRLEALLEMHRQEQNRLESADSVLLAELQSHIVDLEVRMEQTRKAIDDHIDRHPDLRQKRELLESIPGIGEKTSAAVLSVVADVRAFSSAKKLAAFCGLSPRERQSGTSIRGRAGMSKIGCRMIRKQLFFPAMVALQYNKALKDMRTRMLKDGKPKMLIIGAAMRRLVHIIYGVLKHKTPFNENLRTVTPC